MRYQITDGTNPDFKALSEQLDVFLNLVLAYDEGIPVGCAGFRLYQPGIAEVKRFYVSEPFQGKGLGRQIMIQLEKHAISRGFRKLILESGPPLKRAMALYHKLGYREIPNYGPYQGMMESICMEKWL